ncbi:TerC family protein [Microcella daejeonensis]|uniref:TerC family protein n=1 Tax=Microcella daejeonensis TaxID=2994971 RepID=A0A9E8MLC8_9MICO|nr:TerC family protein [Microcella daejeonensis]WAB81641.1 TerC family protein [Microcella daejeonensis]WAB83791.1 TerC family protein [Microcella daejeonensis]
MDIVFTPELLVAFGTLLVLEIVLGIDNVVFISILAGKLPPEQQNKARVLGLSLAMFLRIGLLFAASWVITLTADVFELFGMGFSGKDMILIAGGLFLLYKAVTEIHERLEGEEHHEGGAGKKAATFGGVIVQILLIDLVFSIDSVITAVGMVDELWVMVAAVVIAVLIMLFTAKAVSDFVNRHPTVKMLALAFLVLIGVMLIAEGFEYKIDKALIYGPIAFAIGVEVLNLIARGRAAKKRATHSEPLHLRQGTMKVEDGDVVASTPSGAGDHSI